MTHQQNRGRNLLPAQTRFSERRLATAFQGLVAGLPKVPEPGHLWYNRRRDAGEAPATPGCDAVRAGQIAMHAALATRDRHIIESTALRVQSFADELTAAMLCEYTALSDGAITLEAIGLEAQDRASGAARSVTAAIIDRSPAQIERAIEDATGALRPLRTFADTARKLLANRSTARAIAQCLFVAVTLGLTLSACGGDLTGPRRRADSLHVHFDTASVRGHTLPAGGR